MTQASLAFSSFVSFSHMIFAFMAQISSRICQLSGPGRYDYFFLHFQPDEEGEKDILRHNSRKNEKQDKKAKHVSCMCSGITATFHRCFREGSEIKSFFFRAGAKTKRNERWSHIFGGSPRL
jgi:hypothetical protein